MLGATRYNRVYGFRYDFFSYNRFSFNKNQLFWLVKRYNCLGMNRLHVGCNLVPVIQNETRF